MQNTDKQWIIYLIGVPDIEGKQVHRIVHRKNALICLFLLCTKNKKIPVKYYFTGIFFCFAILSSGETGLWTFLSKILINQHFNSVQFFKCNDLVTENCLLLSSIDFQLSMLHHYFTKIHYFFYTIQLAYVNNNRF